MNRYGKPEGFPDQETDLFDDEILIKGRRWGGLSEFQDVKKTSVFFFVFGGGVLVKTNQQF